MNLVNIITKFYSLHRNHYFTFKIYKILFFTDEGITFLNSKEIS
jgi:hypothetical protein